METELMISASLPWDDGSRGYSDPYTELACEIVCQAVKDYVKLLRSMWKQQTGSKKEDYILELADIEDFFRSDWFEALCDYDPDKVIWNCRQRALEQEKEAIRRKNRRLAKEAVKEKRA